jgi:RimJ/RimL family protein N-acetyltransferase
VTHPYWPLFDLRLSTLDLELRPMTEADQLAVSDLLPDDVELDPAAATYLVDDRLGRRIVVHQTYWRAYGTWRPESWRLNFAVLAAGELIGAQELEGNDFLALRTVETSSFLVTRARGRGFGKQMRRAVLALAFGPLRAQAAITEAFTHPLRRSGVAPSRRSRRHLWSVWRRSGFDDRHLSCAVLARRAARLTSEPGDLSGPRGNRDEVVRLRGRGERPGSRSPVHVMALSDLPRPGGMAGHFKGSTNLASPGLQVRVRPAGQESR